MRTFGGFPGDARLAGEVARHEGVDEREARLRAADVRRLGFGPLLLETYGKMDAEAARLRNAAKARALLAGCRGCGAQHVECRACGEVTCGTLGCSHGEHRCPAEEEV